MTARTRSSLAALIFLTVAAGAKETPPAAFHDSFRGKLGEGWSWVREDRTAWRVSEKGLEVRMQPGNMWGRANNARNVLVRPAPDPAQGEVDVSVTVTNTPTEQWEQVDLAWYYDDSNMVKCGQELVDGKLSIVMGREEGDKCRTIRIIPLDSTTVSLRLIARGNRIRGQFRTPGAQQWTEVGECDLPARGQPNISLQFYQGPAKVERWAQVQEFSVKQGG